MFIFLLNMKYRKDFVADLIRTIEASDLQQGSETSEALLTSAGGSNTPEHQSWARRGHRDHHAEGPLMMMMVNYLTFLLSSACSLYVPQVWCYFNNLYIKTLDSFRTFSRIIFLWLRTDGAVFIKTYWTVSVFL